MSIGKIQFVEQNGFFVLKFVGEVCFILCLVLDFIIEKIFVVLNFLVIIIDFMEIQSIDSIMFGLLVKLFILLWQKIGLLFMLVIINLDIICLLQLMGFDQVFNIVDCLILCLECLFDLLLQDQLEDVVCDKVLEVYCILMGFNEFNCEVFYDLVSVLECY